MRCLPSARFTIGVRIASVDEPARVVARVDSGRGELVLRRRGDIFELISNGVFLMDTSDGSSERLLARVATSEAWPRRVLVGGLGVGFTLAEVLRAPGVEAVTVVEIEEAVVRWNRGSLADVNEHALDDPRVDVVVADLRPWLVERAERFDAICLDIDNGPDWTVTDDNRGLYEEDGLATLRDRLVAGGRLAVWSAAAAPEFERRLTDVFERVHRIESPARVGGPDVVWLAQRC